MRKAFYAILFPLLLLIVSCTERLYFDSAPTKNNEEVKKTLLMHSDLKGVYQLKIQGVESPVDSFQSYRFDGYTPPAIKKTTDDTLQYFACLFLGNQYLEITENNGICHFKNFRCVDKNVFNQFFSNDTRIIKDKSDSSYQTLSASFKNDSIKVSFHDSQSKKHSRNDTTLNFKAWTIGNLICFTEGKGKGINKEFLPDSIDFNNIQKSTTPYLTVCRNQLYFVKKDTTGGINKFDIMNFHIDKNRFLINTLIKDESTQAMSDSLHVKYENGLLHFDDSKLEAIFNSSMARTELKGFRIEGFPIHSEDSSWWSFARKYIYVIGAGGILLFILVWMAYIKRIKLN